MLIAILSTTLSTIVKLLNINKATLQAFCLYLYYKALIITI